MRTASVMSSQQYAPLLLGFKWSNELLTFSGELAH